MSNEGLIDMSAVKENQIGFFCWEDENNELVNKIVYVSDNMHLLQIDYLEWNEHTYKVMRRTFYPEKNRFIVYVNRVVIAIRIN
jgi:gamma-glutamylcyclotransferase (GGCT)/AIG2-like uncharacterized protein YtfP